LKVSARRGRLAVGVKRPFSPGPSKRLNNDRGIECFEDIIDDEEIERIAKSVSSPSFLFM